MKKDTIYFARTKPESTIPSKNEEDAGYDFYCCFKEEEVKIMPGEVAIISSGIATAFPSDYVLIIKERSSTGAICLSIRMGVIDSGYRGELFIGINNTSSKSIIISKAVKEIVQEDFVIYYPYQKAIAQGIYLHVPLLKTVEINYSELLTFRSGRMLKKLGESGK